MYAIIKTGGKQFKVEKGTVIKVEKLDAQAGSEVTFPALMTADGKNVSVGQPVLEGVVVTGKVICHDKAKKVIIFKYKAKTDYRKKQGHRQPYTKVEITEIAVPGVKKEQAPAAAKEATEKKPAATAEKAE